MSGFIVNSKFCILLDLNIAVNRHIKGFYYCLENI